MKLSKSTFIAFVATSLIASTGNVYAHSFNENNGDANNRYERGYEMGEMMGGRMNYNNSETNKDDREFCNYENRHANYMDGINHYGMMGYGQMRGFMMHGVGRNLLSLERLRRLNLNATQQNKIKPILATMQKNRILFRGKMAELRSKMMAAKLSYPIDFNKLSSYISERATLVKDFQKEQLNSLSKIYNSLTPGQKKILAYY